MPTRPGRAARHKPERWRRPPRRRRRLASSRADQAPARCPYDPIGERRPRIDGRCRRWDAARTDRCERGSRDEGLMNVDDLGRKPAQCRPRARHGRRPGRDRGTRAVDRDRESCADPEEGGAAEGARIEAGGHAGAVGGARSRHVVAPGLQALSQVRAPGSARRRARCSCRGRRERPASPRRYRRRPATRRVAMILEPIYGSFYFVTMVQRRGRQRSARSAEVVAQVREVDGKPRWQSSSDDSVWVELEITTTDSRWDWTGYVFRVTLRGRAGGARDRTGGRRRSASRRPAAARAARRDRPVPAELGD